ncbi:hypothetical protein Mgra_00000720 [Meloidogyne graminicola]|uniref:Uncharacterized protein n=1 Tax=Meloidogyne graminicola TaxID=189291 RepID=A0A8T0A2M0_9BILA|nr:hypothetical protein Mgra_00000720 [Meloidogyne graminicola]
MASTSATKSSSLPSLHFKSPESQGYYYWLEPRLLKTITALCTDRTPFDSVSEYLPQLDVLLIRNTVLEQRRLAASLWNVYSELIHSVHKETKINLDNFMHAISASLQGEYEPSLVNNSLNSVVELSETVGFSFTLICPSLNLLLLNNQNIPKFLLWKTLKRLNDALPNGASLLHENFTDICSKLLEYFDEKGRKGL